MTNFYKTKKCELAITNIVAHATQKERVKMKKLIEKYWSDMMDGMATQDKTKITQHFAPKALYKYRTPESMMELAIDDLAAGCLQYKDTSSGKYYLEQIDELKDGRWVSILTSAISGKKYMTVSYFKFENDKIIDLMEYYGDLID